MRVAVGVEEFKRELDAVIGKPLWSAAVTAGDQSYLLLDFGRQIPMTNERRKLAQSEGDEDQGERWTRLFADAKDPSVSEFGQCQGELNLLVWCNWRVEMGEGQILCGSEDVVADEGPGLNGLRQLVGNTVSEVSLSPFLDLLLEFTSGRRLRLFCDQSGHENNDDSYRLFTAAGRMYGVIAGSIERKEVQAWKWGQRGC